MSILAWIALGLLAWVGLSFGIALVIGRGIATADKRAFHPSEEPVRLPDDGCWL